MVTLNLKTLGGMKGRLKMSKKFKIVYLSMALVLGLTVMARADTTMNTTWLTGPGAHTQYDVSTVVNPSFAPVVADLDIWGSSSGLINTNTTTQPHTYGYLDPSPFELVHEHLQSWQVDQSQSLSYHLDMTPQFYGTNPTQGFDLQANGWGENNINCESRNDTSLVESGTYLQMDVLPTNPGTVNSTFTQPGTNQHQAFVELNLPTNPEDFGSMTMTNPISYCQQLKHTVYGDISATGSGSYTVNAATYNGTKPMDYKILGTKDTMSVSAKFDNLTPPVPGFPAGTPAQVTHTGTFTTGIDYHQNWNTPLTGSWPGGPFYGTYFPSSGTPKAVGYEIDFSGNLAEHSAQQGLTNGY